jgi:putative ABC transport system permease protein
MEPARNGRNLPHAIARLKPGVSVATAQSQIDALVARLRSEFPADYPPEAGWTIRLVPLEATVFGSVGRPLRLLLAAVGLVLLIGCVNVANLLLARASARRRELAVRKALGAGRARLIRQLLTESVVLSVAGGVAALVMLFAAERVLLRLVPAGIPRLNDITISWGVMLFAFAVMVVSGIVFGLAPALQGGRVEMSAALRSDARGSVGSREHMRTRRALVVVEFALSMVLMVAAGLLLRSFRDLADARLGFDPEGVLTIRTRLPYPNDVTIDRYRTIEQEAPFLREVLRRCRTLPGAEEVAIGNTTAIPLDHSQRDANMVPLLVEGRGTDAAQAPLVTGLVVTPDYFHLLRIPLRQGRLFTDFDNETKPAVAVINEAMARAFWPDDDPIGRRVKLSRSATSWTTIVGVVANARTESLLEPNVPQIYATAYQKPAKHLAIFIRGPVDAAALPDQVRAQVQLVDDTLPVYGGQLLTDTVAGSLSDRRLALAIVALFAVTALLLAALGIYGVISYMITERRREIGLRLALGAEPGAILRSVLRQGLALTLVGAAAGLVCALVMSRVISGVLYGVRPTDPLTFGVVLGVLVAVAQCACYLPARRALRIDPAIALRAE